MIDNYSINGIQQIGIGVVDEKNSFNWYKQHFGMNIPILHDEGNADLMTLYTGGKSHKRRATIAINLKGGSGFEIWQYVSRKSLPPEFELKLGDFGILITRMKCAQLDQSFHMFHHMNLTLHDKLLKTPLDASTFFIKDPFGNMFQLCQCNEWYTKNQSLIGGPEGCIIGVSSIEKAKPLYMDILGYDQILYDKTGIFEDFSVIPGGQSKIRRLLLTHSLKRQGAFSELLGQSYIELVELINGQGKKIFQNRFWGDQGFIHLCFDVSHLNALEHACNSKGIPFTINSMKSFDMGDASGQFCYIEDPDNTLIEFVETHKIPIIHSIGLKLNIQKRYSNKPIPKWLLNLLKFKAK